MSVRALKGARAQRSLLWGIYAYNNAYKLNDRISEEDRIVDTITVEAYARVPWRGSMHLDKFRGKAMHNRHHEHAHRNTPAFYNTEP
jgi:hypothetical protein